MVFVYVSEAAWGLLFTWQGDGNMFLSCQILKFRQTNRQNSESIISEQASFVICGCVREGGIRH